MLVTIFSLAQVKYLFGIGYGHDLEGVGDGVGLFRVEIFAEEGVRGFVNEGPT